MNPEVGEALAEVKKANVANLPIRRIELAEDTDRALHDRITNLVELMLLLKEQRSRTTSDQKSAIERRIQSTDKQIDQAVYECFELSEEQIALVETTA